MYERKFTKSWLLVLFPLFLMQFPAFGLSPTEAPSERKSGSTNSIGDEEVKALITDIKHAAREEIERAVAEAAKAAALEYLPKLEAVERSAFRWEAEYQRIRKTAFAGKLVIGTETFALGLCLGAAAVIFGGAGR